MQQQKFKTLPLSVRIELLGISQATSPEKPVIWRFLRAVLEVFLLVGAVQPANRKPSTAHERLGEMTGALLKPHAVHDNKWLCDDSFIFTDCSELLLQGHLPGDLCAAIFTLFLVFVFRIALLFGVVSLYCPMFASFCGRLFITKRSDHRKSSFRRKIQPRQLYRKCVITAHRHILGEAPAASSSTVVCRSFGLYCKCL